MRTTMTSHEKLKQAYATYYSTAVTVNNMLDAAFGFYKKVVDKVIAECKHVPVIGEGSRYCESCGLEEAVYHPLTIKDFKYLIGIPEAATVSSYFFQPRKKITYFINSEPQEKYYPPTDPDKWNK